MGDDKNSFLCYKAPAEGLPAIGTTWNDPFTWNIPQNWHKWRTAGAYDEWMLGLIKRTKTQRFTCGRNPPWWFAAHTSGYVFFCFGWKLIFKKNIKRNKNLSALPQAKRQKTLLFPFLCFFFSPFEIIHMDKPKMWRRMEFTQNIFSRTSFAPLPVRSPALNNACSRQLSVNAVYEFNHLKWVISSGHRWFPTLRFDEMSKQSLTCSNVTVTWSWTLIFQSEPLWMFYRGCNTNKRRYCLRNIWCLTLTKSVQDCKVKKMKRNQIYLIFLTLKRLFVLFFSWPQTSESALSRTTAVSLFKAMPDGVKAAASLLAYVFRGIRSPSASIATLTLLSPRLKNVQKNAHEAAAWMWCERGRARRRGRWGNSWWDYTSYSSTHLSIRHSHTRGEGCFLFPLPSFYYKQVSKYTWWQRTLKIPHQLQRPDPAPVRLFLFFSVHISEEGETKWNAALSFFCSSNTEMRILISREKY